MVVVVAASVTSSKRSCSLMLPPPPNVWESPRWFFEGLFVVVVVSLTSSNGTCSLVLPPPPNVWESPRRFFEGLFVVDVVVVCGLRPPFSALQTKSFQSFFGGSTDFCQTGRGSGLTVALEAHWDSSHSPGASVAGVCSGRGFEEHLGDASNAVTFTSVSFFVLTTPSGPRLGPPSSRVTLSGIGSPQLNGRTITPGWQNFLPSLSRQYFVQIFPCSV